MDTRQGIPTPDNFHPTSRAQRRAAKKASRGRTTPASTHSRRLLRNPIAYACEGAQVMPVSKQQRLSRHAVAAVEAMRLGHYTYRDWQHVTTWINILCAINDQGVITQTTPYLAKADEALRAIYHRASGADARTDQHPSRWQPTALWHHELDAVRLLIELVHFTLQTVSTREYEAAHALAVARIKTERGIEDVRKARHYIDKLIETLEQR